MWWAGQSQGLIDSVETCATIVERIVNDAERTIVGLGAALTLTHAEGASQ
jgi:NADH:quinone reductase (non-electrogenic)